MTIILRIPDILSSLDSFKMTVKPGAKEMVRLSNEWYDSYKHLSPEAFQKFIIPSEFPLLSSMCYPDADDLRVRIMGDYTSILYTFDEVAEAIDSSPELKIPEKEAGVAKAGRILMKVFTSETQNSSEPDLPVVSMFEDFWLRYKATSTPLQQQRFIAASYAYVHSLEGQVRQRVKDRCPTIEEYVGLRRNSSAVPIYLVALEYALQIDIPEEVLSHPSIQQMNVASNDIISWTNDIYSFNNEQARGDCHNLVAVASILQNITIQEAIYFARDMVLEAIDRFWSGVAKVPPLGPQIDPIVKKYVDGLEKFTSGMVYWHFESQRYFGESHREIQRTLLVPLNPIEPGYTAYGFNYNTDIDTVDQYPISTSLSSSDADETTNPFESAFASTAREQALPNIRSEGGRSKEVARKVVEFALASVLFLLSSPIYLAPLVPFVILLVLPNPPAPTAKSGAA